MHIELLTDITAISSADAHIQFVFKDHCDTIGTRIQWVDRHALDGLVRQSGFKGELNDVLVMPSLANSTVTVIVGLGDIQSFGLDELRKASGNAIKKLSHANHVIIAIDDLTDSVNHEWAASAIVEGIVMGSYRFDRYRSTPNVLALNQISIVTSTPTDADAILTMAHRGRRFGNATCLARDLANMASNDLTPDHFVSIAEREFKKSKTIELEVVTKKDAIRHNMGAFLAVAQGSSADPALLVIRYRPITDGAPIALIGKGVTFDSGGISIKPGKGMSDMKADMSGAAAVMAAMRLLGELNAPVNVTAVIPLTENMPSGKALKPGDVVVAMNGTSIEVINTDAEGRLILCDAITHAIKRENARMIIDIATLTGACSVALGELAAAVLGNSQAIIDELIASGKHVGEWTWQLPLFSEFKDYLKSDVADIANMSEAGKGGTCTGAKFLEHFVGDIPWAHIDMASMMKPRNQSGYATKGMSGYGARLLAEFILRQTGTTPEIGHTK